MWKSILLFNMC